MRTKIPPRDVLVVDYQKLGSQIRISEKYNVVRNTVKNWFIKYGVPTIKNWRERNRKNIIDKKTLKKMYFIDKLSSGDIAKALGLKAWGRHLIMKRMKEFGIRARTGSEARKGKFDGENSPSYKGAIYKTPSGYLMKKLLLNERGKHRADTAHRVYIHTYNVEKYLERKLKKSEIVHHLDCDRENNNISNLVLFPSQNEHIKFHKFIEHLGMFNAGILKEKPKYKFSENAIIPKEVNIKI